jgi:copper chaperone CopZ
MKTTVCIPGIHCDGCSALIKDVSGDNPSVQSVDVDMATKNVIIEHDDSFDLAAWTAEIESLDPKYKVQSASA